MFQFMRKGDKNKPEKPPKPSIKESKLSSDDLHRLDEIRRSFKIGKGKREKLPSGIIADYSENFTNPLLSLSSNQQFDSYSYSKTRTIESESSESSISTLSLKTTPENESPAVEFAQPSRPRHKESYSADRPPPVPARKPPRQREESNNLTATSSEQSLPGLISRPATSASTSSLTPTYITPPQSPSHGKIQLAKFYSVPELELDEKVLPPIHSKSSVRRTVQVARQVSGEFGFSLRYASALRRDGQQETIVYVEPSQSVSTCGSSACLLPGDRLVCVNSTAVLAKTREEVVKLITTSSDTVNLQVLTDFSWIENIEGILYQKDELESAGKTGGAWLMHKNGFIGARILEKCEDNGKLKVETDTGQLYEVREDDIENTNPTHLDSICELWKLQLINECSLLHVLRNRLFSSLPCTLATHGTLLYLSHNSKLDQERQKVLKQVAQPFTSSKMYPNLYSIVRRSYRELITTRQNQAIIVHGEGTAETKAHIVREIFTSLCVNHLSKSSKKGQFGTTHGMPTANGKPIHERVVALQNVVEFLSFSDKTSQQKITVLYNVEFDAGCRVTGVNAQILCFNFEQLLQSPYFTVLQSIHDLSFCPLEILNPYPQLKHLRKDLLLEEVENTITMQNSLQFFYGEIFKSPSIEASLQKIVSAMNSFLVLGQGETIVKTTWTLFGAVYHLGCVVGALCTVLRKNESINLKSCGHAESHLKRACILLGLPVEHLLKSLGFWNENDANKVKVMMGFSVGLYFEVLNSFLTVINKSNSVCYNRVVQCNNISIVNAGGIFEENGSFGDLSSNYVNERITKLGRDTMIKRLKAQYKTDGIFEQNNELPDDKDCEDSADVNLQGCFNNILPLLDSCSSGTKSKKSKGLLLLIDESKDPCMLLEKFESEFYGEQGFRNSYAVDYRNTVISLCHGNGTTVVDYDMKSIARYVEIAGAAKYTNLLLQESQKDTISCMFRKASSPIIGLCMSSAASEANFRRASSIRRNCSVAWKKNNTSVNIKIQMDYLMDVLGQCGLQFVHCLRPSDGTENGELSVECLRKQIRAVGLPELVRFFKNNFPVHMTHEEFCRKFHCLRSPGLTASEISPLNVLLDILNHQAVCPSTYKIGNSMVAMRHIALEQLENHLQANLEQTVVSFQSFCRGALTRKKAQQMRVRDIAIRCVQKNVRKLFAVKNWTWWKLYQQLVPLTFVESSVQKLQSTMDELVSLKARLERAEAEKHRLKLENEGLEIRVNELASEVCDFETSTSILSEKLEQESSEKAKVESQLDQLKDYCTKINEEKHQLELDLACTISDANGDSYSGQSEWDGDSLFKQKWERSRKELEIQKQRLKQMEQDHMDQIMTVKKSLERKCNDALEETEEQRQIVIQLKRRIQKLVSELSDVRHLLQEETSRAALLDKKQRRFDSEFANLNSLLDMERATRDRTGREKEMALIQMEALNNEMHSLKMELQLKTSKLSSLETELENSAQMSGNTDQINALRKAKNELSGKLKEQEEELDDMAGQLQSLEAAKTRLEMQLEQVKKELKKESQRREEEVEDEKNASQKRVKALQCQLDTEREERLAMIRANKELERKLYDMEEMIQKKAVSNEQVRKLKKELKQTKALLKDAQVLIDQSRNDALSKGALRQLRHQLEDAESQKALVFRAKQKLEGELHDAIQQLEETNAAKNGIEDSKQCLIREKGALMSQLEEHEEQLADVMRKYKVAVENISIGQSTISEQSLQISELEMLNSSLKETIAELNSKLEALEGDQAAQQVERKFHIKVRELETRLELELTKKTHLESQVARLKDHLSKTQEDLNGIQTRESQALEKCRKAERQVTQLKFEMSRLAQKENEALARKAAAEKQLESAEMEIATLKNDLKLSTQRIEDLTAAIKAEELSEDDSSTESVASDIEDMLNLPTLPRDSIRHQ